MRVFFSSYNGNFLELDDLFSVSAIIVRKLASKADFKIYFRAPALKKTLAPYFPCNTKTSRSLGFNHLLIKLPNELRFYLVRLRALLLDD